MQNRNMIRHLVVASAVAAMPLTAAAARIGDVTSTTQGQLRVAGKMFSMQSADVKSTMQGHVAAVRETAPAGLGGIQPTAAGSNLIKNTAGTTTISATDEFDTIQISNGTLAVSGATTTLTALSQTVGGNIGGAVPATLGVQIGQVAGQASTLTVQNGAKLAGINLVGGVVDGAVSTINVDGAGSRIDMNFPLGGGQGWFVANRGTNNINITNGGAVAARFTDLARETGTTTFLNISGVGSSLTTGQIIQRGGDGIVAPPFDSNLTINVTGGGSLTTAAISNLSGLLSMGTSGPETPNTSILNVSGAGSKVSTTQFSAADGFGANTTVSITNGASGTFENLFLTTAAFATGTLNIVNSTATMQQLATSNGEGADATVNVTGSTLNTENVFLIAPDTTGEFFGGTSTVTFTNSTINTVGFFVGGFGSSDSTGVGDSLTVDNSDVSVTEQTYTAFAGGVNSVWDIKNGSTFVGNDSTFLGIAAGSTSIVNVDASDVTFPLISAGGDGGTTGATTTINLTNGATLNAVGNVGLEIPAGSILYSTTTINVTNSTYNAGSLTDGDTGGAIVLTNGTLGLAGNDGLDDLTSGTITGIVGSLSNTSISGTGTINKTGAALEIVLGANSFTGAVNISAGALVMGNAFGSATTVTNSSAGVTQDVLDGTTATQISFAGFDYSVGGTPTLASITQAGPLSGVTVIGGTTALTVGNVRQGELLVFEGSSVTIAPGSGSTVVVAGLLLEDDALTAEPAAFLDLNDNDLVFEYTGASPILALIDAALTGSIIVDGDLLGLPTYLAIAEAADLGLTDFNGEALDDTAVVAKYTFVGDANLDGQVDALDYERVDLAIGNTGVSGVAQGDLNYDGNVDALDYEQIDLNIGNGVGSPLATVLIPEPASLSLVVLGAGLLGRRRRA